MKLEWEILTVDTAHPFGISRNVRTRESVVWLRLEHGGIVAWGEAAPSEYYGETADTVERALADLSPVLERMEDPWEIERIEREVRVKTPGAGAAHAAVSAALHDWIGKRLGQPLWRLWGLDPADSPLSSFTIGIDEPKVVAAKVREAADFPILKIKLGTERDEAMLAAVRSEAPEATLRVDANAGWRADEALDRIAMLADFAVELVEQPLPPEDVDGLRALKRASPIPIFLDESCLTSSDIPGLADLAHGINIKLAKCGGPREALRMINTARACGLLVMMGCMLETSLGIAPAAHMAPLLDYADLDGAALLADDPFEGPRLERGRIVVGDRPGLGVRAAVAQSV